MIQQPVAQQLNCWWKPSGTIKLLPEKKVNCGNPRRMPCLVHGSAKSCGIAQFFVGDYATAVSPGKCRSLLKVIYKIQIRKRATVFINVVVAIGGDKNSAYVGHA